MFDDFLISFAKFYKGSSAFFRPLGGWEPLHLIFSIGSYRCPEEHECVMFQLGSTPVEYENKTQIAQNVAPHIMEPDKVAVRIPDFDKSPTFGKDVKASFQKQVTQTITYKLLHEDNLPFHPQ